MVDISVLIPSYRQVDTICTELALIDTLLRRIVSSYEIILIIDGDEDGTSEMVMKNISLPNLKIVCFSENRGKGVVLQHGMLQAKGDVVAFIDAGGDIDPNYLEFMLELMKFSDADIVVGSKQHPLSEVSYPLMRRIYSRLYQILNKVLFRLDIQDTQVGLKLLKRSVIESVVPQVSAQHFTFDVELLVLASQQGFHIIDSPVHITHKFKSSINVFVALKMVWDTIRIFHRLR